MKVFLEYNHLSLIILNNEHFWSKQCKSISVKASMGLQPQMFGQWIFPRLQYSVYSEMFIEILDSPETSALDSYYFSLISSVSTLTYPIQTVHKSFHVLQLSLAGLIMVHSLVIHVIINKVPYLLLYCSCVLPVWGLLVGPLEILEVLRLCWQKSVSMSNSVKSGILKWSNLNISNLSKFLNRQILLSDELAWYS